MPANSLTRPILFWAPVVFVMGFIFYAGSLPGKDIPGLFPYQDIVFHFLIYACLGFFFFRALKNTNQRLSRKTMIIAAVIYGLLYGISDELHQLFVSGRSSSIFDVSLDTFASLVGSLLYR